MNQTRIWEEKVIIPTYNVGERDKNPMFLEKRVYQGSCGKVYPYPVIDSISDEKQDVCYDAVFLENEFIRIMILPCFGGRIQRAYDKTNGYDFVYYNEVIKPALVGLLGPWISGGIEFNWPQHHRPTTYMSVDYILKEKEDGSVSLFINDLDEMYGTKVNCEFVLKPGKAYIEINASLYNRTPFPQTFLWWANPAVAVNDDTQTVFPPDVTAVFDHGKRDVSKFPIASGVYYKHDYSEGVDISRYKNIPVPTSYMAHKSNYDFVGGYDYGKGAGVLHIADHHVSPGKKQWTWGCGDFGKAWDRNLTDENGPYIELMTGVYTDNQPDFTWLMPFEEKCFTQYFMPYKKAGYVKNANIKAAVNFEKREKELWFCVYPTSNGCFHIEVESKGESIFSSSESITVKDGFERSVPYDGAEDDVILSVYDNDGRKIISCRKHKVELEKLPSPAPKAESAELIRTNEELYLTAQHLEQYRHATFEAEPYYLEGLKRDPKDSRINNAYGLQLMRRCRFKEAEKHFRLAIERLTELTPNPYDSQSLYNLGLCFVYQGLYDAAFDAFYKATWKQSECEMSWYYLAAIASRKKDYEKAYEYVQRALIYNVHNFKARTLKAYIVDKIDSKEARCIAKENLDINPFDRLSLLLLGKDEEIVNLSHDRAATFIYDAQDLLLWGEDEAAEHLLSLVSDKTPMIYYYLAYSNKEKRDEYLNKALIADSSYCFPNTCEDYVVLSWAAVQNENDYLAPYLMGLIDYDRKNYEAAFVNWMASYRINAENPVLLRNLALVLYNKRGEREEALKMMEKAFALAGTDARIFLELLQLYEKTGMPIEKRFEVMTNHLDLVKQRDDLYTEYTAILNRLDRHEEALTFIMARKFHPWEGGEGKITGEYVTSHKHIALSLMKNRDYEEACNHLKAALVYPHNLGEGKLEGAKDNDIHYLLGCCYEKLSRAKEAEEEFRLGFLGSEELANAMYYYDQGADMVFYQGLCAGKLGDEHSAKRKFNKLIDYAENHVFDEFRIDYFAVSLPDLQIWEDDLTLKNKAHYYFIMALGYLGLNEFTKSHDAFSKSLDLNPNHKLALLHERIGQTLISL